MFCSSACVYIHTVCPFREGERKDKKKWTHLISSVILLFLLPSLNVATLGTMYNYLPLVLLSTSLCLCFYRVFMFFFAAHINYKFPTDSDKQELRWHLLKPRIDSKCRAQRRIQRDYQVIGDNHSGIPNKEKPFRSKLTKPSLDPKIKDELLYGVAKPDSVRTPRQHALSYITMETKESDESSDYVEPAQHVDHSHSLTVVIPQ